MVFHVLSIPMYPTRKEITLFAFVQKVYKFCKEMTERGHTVYHYGHPDSDVPCTKHFDVIDEETYSKEYGHTSWKEFHDQHTTNETHKQFNNNSAKIINEIASHTDFVLAFWGFGHKPCCDQLKKGVIVEASIGYDSYFTKNRVFESYAQLHRIIGTKENPSFSDVIIPPGFESDDFVFSQEKDDYLLYLGRMVDSKGISLAQQIAKATQTKIKFVGPQNQKNSLDKKCKYSEFIHTVSYEERAELLSKAKALLMPSLYAEPCGWTMIEAFFSGTPVISTDWGGMSEYNLHGVTGYRCRSASEFYFAVQLSEQINKKFCRKYAEQVFNLKSVCDKYENYFNLLTNGFEKIDGKFKYTAFDAAVIRK